MKENFISPNYKVNVYYQLPFINSYMSAEEWMLFTVMFNHIMTCTMHDKIKNKPIEMTHQWLASKIGKSPKTTQRTVARLSELGILKVYKVDYMQNRYELDWNIINTFAKCQVEGKDKAAALLEVEADLEIDNILSSQSEDKSVLGLRDKSVSHVWNRNVPCKEDKSVSQIINNNEYINKNNNKGVVKPAGTTPKSVSVSASKMKEVEDLISSSFPSKEGLLAKARNSSLITEKQRQYNPQGLSSTTAGQTHSSSVSGRDEAASTFNLQSSIALAPSHPQVAPTPLSPLEKRVIRYYENYYNHGSSYSFGELEEVCEDLDSLISRLGYSFSPETIKKGKITSDYLHNGISQGYFF